LQEGKVCFGTMLRILNTPHAVALCAALGWDYIILDTEHNDYNLETLGSFSLISKYENIGLFVRVSDKLYHQMAQMLDIGAEGLVLPQVKTAEEANHIIRSTKYAPMGQRGVSISNTVTRFRDYDIGDYTRWANEQLMTIVQIESEQGVENVDEIFSTSGIDAVMVGPSDLSMDMGIPGQTDHPRIQEAYHKVIESCNRHSVAPGIHLQTVEEVDNWLNKGMQLITFSYDIAFFKQASRDILTRLHRLI
ncbi:MAG: aldolase/citrate lyase family protein, partial [Cyclobacteriaceae bacterium]